ncbi:MAG: hypothetical protein K2H74_06275 [Paramuribaculum sp.]|nr:hypothetical protein [Paramuribaculum sp.]
MSNALPTPPRRHSSAFSWLGFTLALILFLLVVFVDFLAIGAMANDAIADHSLFILYVLMIVGGGIFWLLALIFSVIGLVVAIKNFTPKWISITGIILCCVSLPAAFIPPFIGCVVQSEPMIVSTPLPQPTTTDKTDIRIVINERGMLECYDLFSDGGSPSMTIDSGCAELAAHISDWMQSRGLTKDASVSIEVDPDAGYQCVVDVIDVMQTLDISSYRICD